MKSDSRETPDVRTSKSIGGSPAVYICSSRVLGVISSGEGRVVVLIAFGRFGGECNVVEDMTDDDVSASSCSAPSEASREDSDAVLGDGESIGCGSGSEDGAGSGSSAA